MTGRINVALADLDGDGRAELVTGPQGVGYGAHVKVFRGSDGGEAASFMSENISPPSFIDRATNGTPIAVGTGVDVACGDVNGDGLADLVTLTNRPGRLLFSTLPYGEVQMYHSTRGSLRPYTPVASVTQYMQGTNLVTAPLSLAVGNRTGDNRVEVIVGSLFDSGTQTLTVLSANLRDAGGLATVLTAPTQLPGSGSTPVRLLARDLSGDGLAELRLGSQPRAADRVSTLLGRVPFAVAPFADDLTLGVEVG